jgi:sterol desaturase/sphingolipid hydroxylase (fatty acid hydroxylase superfamily)
MIASLLSGLSNIGAILAAMALLASIEAAVPLQARGRWNRLHVAPNLALTLITFATNLVFNGALVATLFRLQAHGLGLLPWLVPGPFAAGAVAVLVLDFSFYVAHVTMHRIPAFWRVHRVHHADPAVDVTTTIRQHPVEGVIRYAFMSAFAFALGASPAAFAVYRVWSALNGLVEHANIRAPRWLDDLASLVTTWPNVHKVHHSRVASETNTNFGNIFSLWDRLFRTFTPGRRGTNVAYGLDGLDDAATQTTVGLLALPFRRGTVTGRTAGRSRARYSTGSDAMPKRA